MSLVAKLGTPIVAHAKTERPINNYRPSIRAHDWLLCSYTLCRSGRIVWGSVTDQVLRELDSTRPLVLVSDPEKTYAVGYSYTRIKPHVGCEWTCHPQHNAHLGSEYQGGMLNI